MTGGRGLRIEHRLRNPDGDLFIAMQVRGVHFLAIDEKANGLRLPNQNRSKCVSIWIHEVNRQHGLLSTVIAPWLRVAFGLKFACDVFLSVLRNPSSKVSTVWLTDRSPLSLALALSY